MKIIKHSHHFEFWFDQIAFELLMEKLHHHSIQVHIHPETILNYLKFRPDLYL